MLSPLFGLKQTESPKRNRGRYQAIYKSHAYRVFRAKQLSERDVCEECHSQDDLELHHIKPLSQGGEAFLVENTKVLCACCHRAAHRP